MRIRILIDLCSHLAATPARVLRARNVARNAFTYHIAIRRKSTVTMSLHCSWSFAGYGPRYDCRTCRRWSPLNVHPSCHLHRKLRLRVTHNVEALHQRVTYCLVHSAHDTRANTQTDVHRNFTQLHGTHSSFLHHREEWIIGRTPAKSERPSADLRITGASPLNPLRVCSHFLVSISHVTTQDWRKKKRRSRLVSVLYAVWRCVAGCLKFKHVAQRSVPRCGVVSRFAGCIFRQKPLAKSRFSFMSITDTCLEMRRIAHSQAK